MKNLFSSITDFVSSVLDVLRSVLSSIWEFVRENWVVVLVLIAVVIVVFFPWVIPIIGSYLTAAWGAITSFVGTYGLGWTLAAGLGIAYLIDPEGTKKFLSDVFQFAGEVLGDAVNALSEGLFGMPFGTLLLIAGGGFLLYKAISAKGGSDSESDGSAYA